MTSLRLVPPLVLVFAIQAAAQTPRVARSKVGDTTVIVSTGPGTWGPVRDAVELKRINAETKESTFGAVFSVTALPNGGVVLFDSKSLDGPIIREFDAEGRFVRNIGRRGSGPGEYELGPMMSTISIAARRDGSVIVREASRAVLHYGPDGRHRNTIMLYHSNGSTNEVVASNDGTIWVRAAFPQMGPLAAAPSGLRPMIHFDSTGKIIDSLVHGAGWTAPGSDPAVTRAWWVPIADGRVLHTRGDKVGFLLADPKGTRPLLVAETVAEAVRYSAEERKEMEELEDFRQKMPRPMPRRTIPETKPLANGAFTDIDGRIWVSRPGPGQKTKPRVVASFAGQGGTGSFSSVFRDQNVYVAFQPDGTLLGEVRFPAGVAPSFVGNTAWGIVRDADDTPILVKYRIN